MNRFTLPSSSRSKESSSSSSRTGASARGRSPRRSRSPSPRGRRRRSPSSSRSSRRSPSPRRTSRARYPSGDSRSRRESEQRDGSLSQTHSPRRHLHSSQRHLQFQGSYSPSRHPESSVEQTLRSEFSSEQRKLSENLSDADRDGKLFTKSLDLSEKEWVKPKHPRYDVEDRQLDVSTDPLDFLTGKRNYYKQRLSPVHTDKDFGKFESAWKKKEDKDLSRNTSQDNRGKDYMICGLQSSESQHFYKPEEAPAVPKKSILKKRVDDPSIQNFGNVLRQKDSQELTSKSPVLHDNSLLPHERASQDECSFLRILGGMADSVNAQEKRRCNFLDVEEEEKFLYGDDEDGSSSKYPSTEKLTMNRWKESLSLNARSPSPIKSIKPDTLEGSRIAFEKVRDLLKTIGLDIAVVEIDKGAARTEERLCGKKTLCSLDGHSVDSYKPESSEKDSIQSSSHSSESNQKNSLSSGDFFKPSNDVSISISEHVNSKTLGHSNSASTSQQSFFPVSVTPSAPPSLPNLPPPTPPISQYPVPYFSAYTTAQLLPNHPLPTMAPPSYNAYGQYMSYSASAWPMYAPPQQSNPALPDVHGLVSGTVPPKPTWPNLRVTEIASIVKENPEMQRNNPVLVEIPITPTNSKMLSRHPIGGTTERISNGRNLASEVPKGPSGASGGGWSVVQPAYSAVVDANCMAADQEWPPDVWPVSMDSVENGGAVVHRGRQRILICGHSKVFWAAHQAKRTPFGSQLGLSKWATVEWQGHWGLRWPGLLPLLFEGRRGPPPHILVIHLGGNDLGLVKGKGLSLQVEEDLHFICQQWPGVLIVWSAMLPRRVWHGVLDPRGIDRARRKANRVLQKVMEHGLGLYLPHPNIRPEFADLYSDDGVHLSVKGNNIFLTDLQQGLQTALSHLRA